MHPFAAAPVRAGCHSQLLRGRIVHAAARAVARIERRPAHGCPRAQVRLETVGAKRGRVLSRRHADDALERPLQMRRAHSRGTRDVVERVGLIEMCLHVCAGPRDDALRRALGRARLAAQARAKARCLRRVGIRVERHVRAQRSPRGAARLAVHARRRDRVHEVSVLVAIARDHRRPALVLHGATHDDAPAVSRARVRTGDVAADRRGR